MNCAINSLPEPLAPVMNTEASVGATRRARSIARRKIGATPSTCTRSLLPCSFTKSACCCFESVATLTVCTARPMRIWKCVAENGLGR